MSTPQHGSEFDAADQRASDHHQGIAEISEAKGKSCISHSVQRLPSHKRDSDSESCRQMTKRCSRRKQNNESGMETEIPEDGHETEAVDEHGAEQAADLLEVDTTDEGQEGTQWRPYVRRAGVQSMDLDAICMPAR